MNDILDERFNLLYRIMQKKNMVTVADIKFQSLIQNNADILMEESNHVKIEFQSLIQNNAEEEIVMAKKNLISVEDIRFQSLIQNNADITISKSLFRFTMFQSLIQNNAEQQIVFYSIISSFCSVVNRLFIKMMSISLADI